MFAAVLSLLLVRSTPVDKSGYGLTSIQISYNRKFHGSLDKKIPRVSARGRKERILMRGPTRKRGSLLSKWNKERGSQKLSDIETNYTHMIARECNCVNKKSWVKKCDVLLYGAMLCDVVRRSGKAENWNYAPELRGNMVIQYHHTSLSFSGAGNNAAVTGYPVPAAGSFHPAFPEPV